MQGFIKGKPAYVQTFDRWFGAQSVLPLPRDLRELVIDNMRLVIDTKQEIPDSELQIAIHRYCVSTLPVKF
jgi:polar amino acid transport system substrate-binding protein